jgi:kinesin family member 5
MQLNELRLQVEKLEFDNKESVITVDILKEQNADARNELDELKRTIAELRSSQRDPSAEDKEKKKQEKMALMMAQFDMASITSFLTNMLTVSLFL